jgi:hypothetical protein
MQLRKHIVEEIDSGAVAATSPKKGINSSTPSTFKIAAGVIPLTGKTNTIAHYPHSSFHSLTAKSQRRQLCVSMRFDSLSTAAEGRVGSAWKAVTPHPGQRTASVEIIWPPFAQLVRGIEGKLEVDIRRESREL